MWNKDLEGGVTRSEPHRLASRPSLPDGIPKRMMTGARFAPVRGISHSGAELSRPCLATLFPRGIGSAGGYAGAPVESWRLMAGPDLDARRLRDGSGGASSLGPRRNTALEESEVKSGSTRVARMCWRGSSLTLPQKRRRTVSGRARRGARVPRTQPTVFLRLEALVFSRWGLGVHQRGLSRDSGLGASARMDDIAAYHSGLGVQ